MKKNNLKQRLKNQLYTSPKILKEQEEDPTWLLDLEECNEAYEEWDDAGIGTVWSNGLIPGGVEFAPPTDMFGTSTGYTGPNTLIEAGQSYCNLGSSSDWLATDFVMAGAGNNNFIALWDYALEKIQAGEMDMGQDIEDIVFLGAWPGTEGISAFNGQEYTQGVVNINYGVGEPGTLGCGGYENNGDYCEEGGDPANQLTSWSEAPAAGPCAYNGGYWKKMNTYMGIGGNYEGAITWNSNYGNLSSEDVWWGALLGDDYEVFLDTIEQNGSYWWEDDFIEQNQQLINDFGMTEEQFQSIITQEPMWDNWGQLFEGVTTILSNATLKQCPGGGTDCEWDEAEFIDWDELNWYENMTSFADVEAYLEQYFLAFEIPDGQYAGAKIWLADYTCHMVGGCFKDCMCQCREEWCKGEDEGTWITGDEVCPYAFGCTDPSALNYNPEASPGNPFVQWSNYGSLQGESPGSLAAITVAWNFAGGWAYYDAYSETLSGYEEQLGPGAENLGCQYSVGCTDLNASNFDMSIVETYFNQNMINWDNWGIYEPGGPSINVPTYAGNISIGTYSAFYGGNQNLASVCASTGNITGTGYTPLQNYINCYLAAGAFVTDGTECDFEDGVGPWMTMWDCIDDYCVEGEPGEFGEFTNYQDCLDNGCIDTLCDAFNESTVQVQYNACQDAQNDWYNNQYITDWGSDWAFIGLGPSDAYYGVPPLCCPPPPGCIDPSATNFTADQDWYFWDYVNPETGIYGWSEYSSGYNEDLPYNGWTIAEYWSVGFDNSTVECEYPDGFEGCIDPIAENYNEEAMLDDGSCIYIPGCTDGTALNYNEEATQDDGSCEYICDEFSNYIEENNLNQENICQNYYNILAGEDIGNAEYQENLTNLIGDNQEQCCPPAGCMQENALNYDETAEISIPNFCQFAGCMDPLADNYDPDAVEDDGSCSGFCYEFNTTAVSAQDQMCNIQLNPENFDLPDAVFIAAAQFTENGSCCPEIACADFNELSEEDQDYLCYWWNNEDMDDEQTEQLGNYTNNGLCCPEEPELPKYTCNFLEVGSPGICQEDQDGEFDSMDECEEESSCSEQIMDCLDESAINYNPDATVECDDCCEYTSGCTDENALNYNPEAVIDDGSCIEIIYGCTDQNADNYNELATEDDDSCVYPACDEYNSANEEVQIEYCALWNSSEIDALNDTNYNILAEFLNYGECCPAGCEDMIDVIQNQSPELEDIEGGVLNDPETFCDACDYFDQTWWSEQGIENFYTDWCGCCDEIFPKKYTCISPPPDCAENECFIPFCQPDPDGEYDNLGDCEFSCPGDDWVWPDFTKYSCNYGWGAAEGQAFGCTENPDGEFDSIDECEEMCVNKKYKCLEGWGAAEGQGTCIEDSEGEFDSIYECEKGCPRNCDNVDLEEFIVSIGYVGAADNADTIKFCRDCDDIQGFSDQYWQCKCCPEDEEETDKIPCYKCKNGAPVGWMFSNPPGCQPPWQEEIPDCKEPDDDHPGVPPVTPNQSDNNSPIANRLRELAGLKKQK